MFHHLIEFSLLENRPSVCRSCVDIFDSHKNLLSGRPLPPLPVGAQNGPAL